MIKDYTKKPPPFYSILQGVEEVDIENHVWVTARRKRCLVKQMTTKHIRNCINCWLGKGNLEIPDGYLGGKEKWLTIFNNELIKRQ